MLLRVRLTRLVFVAFVAISIAGCGCSKKPGEGGGAAALPPVPPPPGLLADIVAPTPEATWGKARALVGGGAALMPQGFGPLVATLLGLPIAVGGEIDGNVPVLGALADQGAGPPRMVLAVHVKEGGRFVDQVTKGEGAKFTAKPDAATQITMLEPSAQAPTAYALGVLANYLLIAPTREEMTSLGPYAARTLSTAPPPKEDLAIDLPEAALAGPVQGIAKRAVDTLSSLRSQGGPLAGNLGAPLITEGLSILGDCSRARLTLVLDAAQAHANLVLRPKPGNGPAASSLASLAVGDPRRVLELPTDTVLAATWHESHAARAAKSAAYVDALEGVLQTKFSGPEREAVGEALRTFAEARGDWAVGGLAIGQSGLVVYLREAIGNEDEAKKAVKVLEAAIDTPTLKARLKQADLSFATSTIHVDGVPGEVKKIHVERGAKATAGASPLEGALPKSFDVLVAVNREIWLVAGNDPRPKLAGLMAAPSAQNFGSAPEIRASLDALGTDVSFAFVVDPLRALAAARAGAEGASATPVVLAFGKHAEGQSGELWGRLDVANAAIRLLASEGL